MDVTLNF